ncbi:MAG: type II secretion system F family protein [Nanoarchaeota archaeon]|nr:type II secretion system F family protein [Nanoarchaeota archaeon]
MEFKNRDFIGTVIGLVVIGLAYLFANQTYLPLFAGLGVIIAVMPILIKLITENKIQTEKEEMFLEFSRNLVESVKTGTPISKSIINMKNKNFRSLSPHIKKLANQISLGIPLNKALNIFSKDVNNKSITRSLTLIGQAERAGGDIGEILESVAEAVSLSDKLKKERKAAISSLVSQGYIIFLVFIVIILVLQFQIIPMVSGMGDLGGSLGIGSLSSSKIAVDQQQISNSFLYLILVQGFFTGLIIGKLAEGNIKSGVKHSFGLMFLSFIISTLANIIFSI